MFNNNDGYYPRIGSTCWKGQIDLWPLIDAKLKIFLFTFYVLIKSNYNFLIFA
jgi:hypothetical protein